MAIMPSLTSIDGDLPLSTKRRSDGVPTLPALPGDPARAKRMSAQAEQPVIGPRGPVMAASSGGTGAAQETTQKPVSILDGIAGGAKAVAGAAALPLAAGVDAARAGIASAVGGDPDTLPGGRSRYTDAASATMDEGWDQASGAAQELKAKTRTMIGVQPASVASMPVPAAAKAPAVPATSPASAAGAAAASAPAVQPGYMRTGIGGGLAGGEIAVKRGADGVIEFTNDAQAVRSAGAMPSGGIGGIGDGIGTFSQAEPGSAKLALERFERAGQEHEKMIAASRRGQIGEGGGRVTVIRDSSRSPTLAEVQNARLEAGLAQTEALRAQTAEGIASGLDARLTSQMQRQQTQQGIDSGLLELQNAQQLQQLRAQLADPSLSAEQREIARDTYTSLSTPAKDRFKPQDVILGRDENGRDIRGTQLIDVTTGRPVAGIGDNLPAWGGAPAVGTRKGGYEFLGGDPADQKNWKKV